MSLEELWELFPIILKEHNPEYKKWYLEEKEKLIKVLDDDKIVRINHIGSTAIKGLIAKPTVDILLEIKKDYNLKKLKDILKKENWILMHENDIEDLNLVFNKGYTPEGFAEKVFHLHVRYPGDYDEIYFRDYLIKHDKVAKEYEKLKKELEKKYKNNRDAYTEAKSVFIKKWTKKAREEFDNKYK
ncbi:MAG: GrpB family protein [Bacillota bacterium]